MEWKTEAQFAELIAFCVLMGQAGAESELKRHAAANMRLGNSREFLRQVLAAGAPYMDEERAQAVNDCIDSIAKVE